MARPINTEKIPEWYDPYELKALFLHNGYDDYGDVAKDVFGVTSAKSARAKINACRLTHEEMLALAKRLKMSPSEFLHVFCKDLFE